MDDAGLPQVSGDLQEFSASPVDDIPVAVREAPDAESRFPLRRRLLLWGIGSLGAIALIALAIGVVSRIVASQTQSPQLNSAAGNPGRVSLSGKEIMGQAIVTLRGGGSAAASVSLLGHLPYEEAPQEELRSIAVNGGSVALRKIAADKFIEMANAAKADNVILLPISGFRSVSDQEHVFFDVKAERGQETAVRAEVSAPPGYSEHHTGYAVDIGDGDHPGSDLQPDFEETQAFKWLKENAPRYSFEMSFPKGNAQGVSYEPWHWRFVGDRHSLETFYRARTSGIKLNSQQQN